MVQRWQRHAQFMWQGEFSPGAHVALRDEPIQFRLKCGRDDFRLGTDVARARPVPLKKVAGGEPSPGTDVAGGEPSPGADVAGGEPSPGADVEGGEPSPGADVAGCYNPCKLAHARYKTAPPCRHSRSK